MILSRTERLVFTLLILLFCTGFDRITKNVARERLASAAPISLLSDTIRIQYSENPGGTLSVGAGLSPEARFLLFVILSGLISIVTLVYALASRDLRLMQFIGLVLIASGGLGNLLDRLLNDGAAIDFLNIGIGSLRTGIFNVADVFIVAGVVMFVLFSLRQDTNMAAAPE
jgi:signal peptidase II